MKAYRKYDFGATHAEALFACKKLGGQLALPKASVLSFWFPFGKISRLVTTWVVFIIKRPFSYLLFMYKHFIIV